MDIIVYYTDNEKEMFERFKRSLKPEWRCLIIERQSEDNDTNTGDDDLST